ncbi:MAG: transposase [Gemmatimonadaceae bacterium]|nr:transposase [Gemmatimonadaceae bacterium]
MARIARVVIPGLAHHVTQRGNGRQRTFHSAEDCLEYLHLLRRACAAQKVTCLAYCLMPNHVHLILEPATGDGLRRSLAVVHQRYAQRSNARHGVTGHFWQGRYGSVPMDDAHLYEALRYVLLNPVRASLAQTAAEWRWSSARAYLTGADDGLTHPRRLLRMIGNVATYLGDEPNAQRVAGLRAASTIGRPVGSPEFVRRLEALTGRGLAPKGPGRPARRK